MLKRRIRRGFGRGRGRRVRRWGLAGELAGEGFGADGLAEGLPFGRRFCSTLLVWTRSRRRTLGLWAGAPSFFGRCGFRLRTISLRPRSCPKLPTKLTKLNEVPKFPEVRDGWLGSSCDNQGMNGIQFVTDEKGRKLAVQIDLKEHRELWEDIEDVLVSRSRRHEKRVPLGKVKAGLVKSGKLVRE